MIAWPEEHFERFHDWDAVRARRAEGWCACGLPVDPNVIDEFDQTEWCSRACFNDAALRCGVVKAPTDDGEWHTLEFRAEGSKLTATLDGKYTATAWDSFFMKGRAGLWTKSDSITEFDAVSFVPVGDSSAAK